MHRNFEIEVDARLALDQAVYKLQVLAARQVIRVSVERVAAQQNDQIAIVFEADGCMTSDVLSDSERPDDRRRVDALAVRLVVEADVAADYWGVEPLAGLGHAGNRVL